MEKVVEKSRGVLRKWTFIFVPKKFCRLEICKRGRVAASSCWEGLVGGQLTA